jgi:lipid-A-disaccharide synthase
MSPMTIYFVAGEISGDDHGAALMRRLRGLRTDLQFSGRGGPQMKAIAGEAFHNWISDAGVVGLWEVIRKYPYFRRKFRETLNEIDTKRPDAVILIDYPGFNLRLARALRQRTSRLKIIYYVSPQVWAWNRGRVKRMARWLDLMLCIFPFEAELYNASGLRTIFVGHPMIERLGAQQNETSRDPNLIALFPGSRRREVRKIFPVMLKTATELLRIKPDLRFEVAAPSVELAQEMQQIANPLMRLPAGRRAGNDISSPIWKGIKGEGPGEGSLMRGAEADGLKRIQIRIGEAAQIMQRAFVGIIASGTATQEAAYHRLPFVLVYKVSWPTYMAARFVIKVDYLGMPNVLANREIVPEFIQHQAKPGNIAKAVRRLIDEPSARAAMISAFDQVIASLGKGGASDRAARAILDEIRA